MKKILTILGFLVVLFVIAVYAWKDGLLPILADKVVVDSKNHDAHPANPVEIKVQQMAVAINPPRQDGLNFEKVARLLDGRLINSNLIFYRVLHAQSVYESNGTVMLDAVVDPLFAAKYSYAPDGQDGDRSYYNVKLDQNAECGMPREATSINTSDFLVFHKGEFVTPREFIENVFPGTSIKSYERPVNRVTPDILNRLQDCAERISKLADSMPFSRISLYASENLISEIRRTSSPTWSPQEGIEDGIIEKLSHLEIEPNNSSIENFTVNVSAVYVLRCNYGGTHLVLDNWKQGISEPEVLERSDNKFLIGTTTIPGEMPLFPAYTQDELFNAISKQMGSKQIASNEVAKSCTPILRNHRFTVRYLSKTVQVLNL